jgi:hypothetical protein
MKTKIYRYLALSAFLITVTAHAEVDRDFMSEMEDLNKSLSSNIAVSDGKAAAADAQQMKGMFEEVEAFFIKKTNAEDGVKWAQESRDLSAAIAKAVAANDFDTASQTAVTLSKTCKACHKIYKKKGSD